MFPAPGRSGAAVEFDRAANYKVMVNSPLVLGIDSSTQSTKAVLVDAVSGELVATQSSGHPSGTSIDPRHWLDACDAATDGLLDRASAVAVAGQQHGMVALDAAGDPVRDALLWNDVRSAASARDLVDEMGGPAACAETLGSVLVASFTASKLRWLRDNEPEAAGRVDRVMLPHDYVAWHLSGRQTEPFTDRGDASGTGYYELATGDWRMDLAGSALGKEPRLPGIVPPGEVAFDGKGFCLASGTGDNMAAALGLGLEPGDIAVSIGTSGVASAISSTSVADASGAVTCFADATTNFLPLVTTMNAARILDLQAALLGVDHEELAGLALSSPPGSGGLSILPYYGGERTPNRPSARGTWSGLNDSTSRADLARAAFEALLCSLADAVDSLRATMPGKAGRLFLIGGAAKNKAVREIAPSIFGQAVQFPADAQYAAIGAARQAAWALSGSVSPPNWASTATEVVESEPTPAVREGYRRLRDQTAEWA